MEAYSLLVTAAFALGSLLLIVVAIMTYVGRDHLRQVRQASRVRRWVREAERLSRLPAGYMGLAFMEQDPPDGFELNPQALRLQRWREEVMTNMVDD